MKKTLNRIENLEGVTKIIMKPTACVFCHIGKDWYNCQFEVEFIPAEFYPDYMEVAEFVSNEIDGQELNIEQACKKLRDFLLGYEPDSCYVKAIVTGCKTHFGVEVTVG